MVNVTLDLASGPGEPILILVKLQSPAWELHWSAAEGTATVMVGGSDETWDIAVEVPVAAVEAIAANAAAGAW